MESLLGEKFMPFKKYNDFITQMDSRNLHTAAQK